MDTVRFVGNATIKSSDLAAGLKTQETRWWWWAPGSKRQWYIPSWLDDDLKRVRSYYAHRGFFRMQVGKPEVASREEGQAVGILFRIREGKRTHIESLDLNGFETLPAALANTLQNAISQKAGAAFDYDVYQQSKATLADLLHREGYAYAQVQGKARVDRARAMAIVEYRVESGPLVHLGKVSIVGGGGLPVEKLKHLLSVAEGDRYDPQELERSRAILFNQRLFSSVKTTLPQSPTATADVKLDVEQGKLHRLQLGIGLGIERKRHQIHGTIAWTWRNFGGGLRILSMTMKPAFVVLPTVWDSQRLGFALDSKIKLMQPDIFATGIGAFAQIGYDVGIDEAYQYHGPLTSLGLERGFFRDRLTLGLSWNLRFYDFFNVDEEAYAPEKAPPGLGFIDPSGPYRLAYLAQFAKLELVDSTKDTRAGFTAELRLEEGAFFFGGEFDYVKLQPDLRGYIPLGTKRLVLAVRATFAYLHPLGEQNSPVTQRIGLGGPNSHRGFTYGRLSPQTRVASGELVPQGGNAAILFSSDLRLRMVELFGGWLSLAAFFDVGDAVAQLKDLSVSQLHLAVGGSLSYQTPIGAIRFGIGVRINRLARSESDGRTNPDPGDRLAYHLSIGQAF